MKHVSICLPYYRNHGMLVEQCKRFRALPDMLKAYLELVVVDDGSAILQPGETELPQYAQWAQHEEIGFPFSLYRINVNVRWNQDAARNIAAKVAKSEWLLLTDIDHIPPVETLEALVTRPHEDHRVYRFSRKTLDGTHKGRDVLSDYKPHPNTWFMTKAAYWKMGGYDERFAGWYGTDADFRDRVKNVFGEPLMLGEHVIRVPRDRIPDASTTTWERKAAMDAELGAMIRKRNLTPGWQVEHFRFPYERIA